MVERLKFVAGARQLDFSLDGIAEILALRDRREAPCRVVLDLLEQKAREVARRIEELVSAIHATEQESWRICYL